MEPIDIKPEEITTTTQPKHNSLLLVLLIILIIAIVVIGGLFVYQNLKGSQTATPVQTHSTTSEAIDPALTVPVTTNIDNEVKVLDNSISSQNTDDLSPDNLSDTNLGL